MSATRSKYGQPWTATQDSELEALTTAANSVHDIALALGRTVAEVLARQQELGIRQPHDGRRVSPSAELLRDAAFSKLVSQTR